MHRCSGQEKPPHVPPHGEYAESPFTLHDHVLVDSIACLLSTDLFVYLARTQFNEGTDSGRHVHSVG